MAPRDGDCCTTWTRRPHLVRNDETTPVTKSPLSCPRASAASRRGDDRGHSPQLWFKFEARGTCGKTFAFWPRLSPRHYRHRNAFLLRFESLARQRRGLRLGGTSLLVQGGYDSNKATAISRWKPPRAPPSPMGASPAHKNPPPKRPRNKPKKEREKFSSVALWFALDPPV